MERAFFVECNSSYWRIATKILASRKVIYPVFWAGVSDLKRDILNIFPDIIWQNCDDAKRLTFAKNSMFSNFGFDNVCQQIWIQDAQVFYEMMNRIDAFDAFTHLDRTQYFYNSLVHWNAVINKLKPGVLILPTAPHALYDYIIYRIFKLKKLRVVMFEETTVSPYSLVQSDYDSGSPYLENEYRLELGNHANNVELSEDFSNYLSKIKKDYTTAKPIREVAVEKEFSDWKRLRILFGLVKSDVFALLKRMLKRRRSMPLPYTAYYKEKGKPLQESFTGSFSRSKYWLLKWHDTLKSRDQKQYFRKMTSSPRLENNYVYWPLHQQPERTSCPQGGIFSNQLLMANILSHSLPEGWLLYIKEHPNQFHGDMMVSAHRNKEFYDILASFKNTVLVHDRFNPFELIDNSRAVCTITGTTGIEALIRGKPVIVFGNPWYSFCEGVFAVRDLLECEQALKTIENSFEVDERKVQKLFAALNKTAFRGLSDPDAGWHEVSDEDNAIAICDQIEKVLEIHKSADTVE